MAKPLLYKIMIVCALVLTLHACEKVEIPVYGSAEGGTSSSSTTVPEEEAMTVEEAFEAYEKSDAPIAGTYVKGYIVGYASGTSITSVVFGTKDAKETNIIIASSLNEEDTIICMPVQLTKDNKDCTATRKALNLASHPEMFHKKVIIKGTIDSYFGTTGLKKASAFKILSEEGSIDTPSEEDGKEDVPGEDISNPSDNEGDENAEEKEEKNTNDEEEEEADYGEYTKEELEQFLIENGKRIDNPLKPSEVRIYVSRFFEMFEQYEITNRYIEGYIVGYIKKGKIISTATLEATGAVDTNIVIADSPEETNRDLCIAIALDKTETRQALNLKYNSKNIGKKVLLNGTIKNDYYGAPGLKNTKVISLEQASPTD